MTRSASARSHVWAAAFLAAVCACGASQSQSQSQPQPQPQPQRQPQPPAVDTHLFDRIAVIGASVSAGFAAPRIAASIKTALGTGEHAREDAHVLDAANVWMFRDAWTDGASEAILSPAAIPPVAELARMNARIHAWAAARTAATDVLPLGDWSRRLAGNERLELAPGETVEARSLLFLDGLHVNALGLWWMLTQLDAALEADFHADADGLRFIR